MSLSNGLKVSTNKLAEFNQDLNALANYDYLTTTDELSNYIQNNIQGPDYQVWNTIENIFYDNMDSYLSASFNGLMLNNMTNLNTFVKENLNDRVQSDRKMLDRARNEIYKSRYGALDHEWNLYYQRHVRFLLLVSCLAGLFVYLFFFGIYSKRVETGLSITALVIVFLVYIGIVFVNIRQKNRRQLTDWTKYNFKVRPPE